MLRDEVAEVICKDCACNGEAGCDTRKGVDCPACLATTDKCLALMRKLVDSKKNMPELMLSEYGKGQNAVVDDLLSELR